MSTGLLRMASLNFEPLYYRPHGAGDWSGHVPFAYDLVAALRPSLIVELGTHYGESYFTFCQAIVECGVACRAFAVDTWRGDPHTGAYGEAVLREVSAHNQQHYASFSTLLRTFFDEALEHFPGASIDLLHIDGLHTYEAVRHDFETWFPKVSAGGIVLLHDTRSRRNDFGVWRLWDELRRTYESFEFPHSCGLGVIRKPDGHGAPSGLATLLFQNEEQAEALRRFYLICGERLEYRDRAARQQRTGEWELLAELYWRAAGEEFSEERSFHSRCEVSAMPTETRLELPRGTSFGQLRIDLLESPVFMRIHAVRLLGPKEELLWSLPMKDIRENLACTGLRFTPGDNIDCVVARLAGEPASILLSIPQPALDQLTAGGILQLQISGLEAEEYAGALNSMAQQYLNRALAAESTLAVSLNETVALARGLAEAQNLVRKHQSDLSTCDHALSEAQELMLEREAELRGLDNRHRKAAEPLNRPERSLADREARILHLTQILAQTRKELAGREQQLCNSAATLSEAQRQAAMLEQDFSQVREEARRRSASFLELEHLHDDCSRRLREIETSLIWRLTRPLRRLPRF
ncbi:MAG: class I SAM-dependent methyltransferase [Candidatus Solibacter sp.]|nr:class I SAM-dependent methyltransferase [Candidatus Solibacter sp.]